MHHIVFTGNPGVGKSFIINSLLGETAFASGIELGTGKTQFLQSKSVGDVTYSDTPGLDDVAKREKAAKEISQALTGGGVFKLIFVCTLEEGRVKPADLTTIKLVLQAIEAVGVQVENKYSVIVNKCNTQLMELFQLVRNREKIRFFFAKQKILSHIAFCPTIPEAEGQTDFLLKETSIYEDFVARAPTIELPQDSTVNVDVTHFDTINEKLEEELKELRTKVQQYEEQANTKNRSLEAIFSLVKGFSAGVTIYTMGGGRLPDGALGAIASIALQQDD